jgi:hypothetical protein
MKFSPYICCLILSISLVLCASVMTMIDGRYLPLISQSCIAFSISMNLNILVERKWFMLFLGKIIPNSMPVELIMYDVKLRKYSLAFKQNGEWRASTHFMKQIDKCTLKDNAIVVSDDGKYHALFWLPIAKTERFGFILKQDLVDFESLKKMEIFDAYSILYEDYKKRLNT